MRIECGVNLNPENVDTNSSGVDGFKLRKPENVFLYATCPKPSLDGNTTYITLTIPAEYASHAQISNCESKVEAKASLISSPLYKCDGFKNRWCPLYEGLDKISYRQFQLRQLGIGSENK